MNISSNNDNSSDDVVVSSDSESKWSDNFDDCHYRRSIVGGVKLNC